MKRKGLILWALALLALLAALLAPVLLTYERVSAVLAQGLDRVDVPAAAQGEPGVFVVKAGESATEIGNRLKEAGLVRSPWLFRLLVSLYRMEAGLEAGEYELSPSMTSTEIIAKLHRGLVRTTLVTIPEGWRAAEVAERLDRRGVFPAKDFLAALAQGGFHYDFLTSRPRGANLEGYLFPDTYKVSPGVKPADFIDLMLANFERRFTPQMRRRAEERGLTIHQVATLASIVEREAKVAAERPIIASVFLNRLARNMPLQADPTIQYALANDAQNVSRFGYWKERLTPEDMDIVSPYNTYRNFGLPPGPIGNAGLASLQAVLEPAPTDFLYFVARGDGSHVFARTLEEHNQNVARYRG